MTVKLLLLTLLASIGLSLSGCVVYDPGHGGYYRDRGDYRYHHDRDRDYDHRYDWNDYHRR
jgi:hypothetical protein